MIFELEGESQRVLKAGTAFWEPGGDVIHYQDGDNLAVAESQFVVTMFGAPDQPMLIPVSAEELAERRDRRGPDRCWEAAYGRPPDGGCGRFTATTPGRSPHGGTPV